MIIHLLNNNKVLNDYYLDNTIPVVEGGDIDYDGNEVIDYSDDKYDFFDDYIEKYLRQIRYCGQERSINKKTILINCKKLICPKCGGEGKYIHRKRYGKIKKRISKYNYKALRQIVFTVPMNLRRKYFMNKDNLNKLFKIVERIIKKEFGVLVKERKAKKGIKRKFNLKKPAVAIIHLFGRDDLFNPHINVLIFEDSDKSNNLILTNEKLNRMRSSYKNVLQRLLKSELDNIVINYKFKKGINNSIWYMTTPMKPDIPEYKLAIDMDFGLFYFLTFGLYKFHHLRFWGLLANSEYKKHQFF